MLHWGWLMHVFLNLLQIKSSLFQYYGNPSLLSTSFNADLIVQDYLLEQLLGLVSSGSNFLWQPRLLPPHISSRKLADVKDMQQEGPLRGRPGGAFNFSKQCGELFYLHYKVVSGALLMDKINCKDGFPKGSHQVRSAPVIQWA